MAQANVITNRNFDEKIIEIENNIKKIQTFDSGYFRGKSYFEEHGTQNYLVFQPIIRYFKIIANTTITPSATSANGLTLLIDHYGTKIR